MIALGERSRKTWYVAGGLVLLVAVGLVWTISGMFPRSPDDPAELLRHASGSAPADALKPVGKPIKVQATSSAGTPVTAKFSKFADKSGRVGFVPHLGAPLKEGETVTLKMPGGGGLVIGTPTKGQAATGPGQPNGAAPAKQP